MKDESGVTGAGDVALPVVEVTLKHLKTTAGLPVVVGCCLVSELTMAGILNALPGLSGAPSVEVPEDAAAAAALASQAMAVAPAVIEAGTFLGGPGGTQVRPAFTWRDPPGESIPGRYLRDDDKMALLEAILRVSGYIQEVAEEASFPVHGEGGGGGVGVVEAGPGDGADAMGGPA